MKRKTTRWEVVCPPHRLSDVHTVLDRTRPEAPREVCLCTDHEIASRIAKLPFLEERVRELSEALSACRNALQYRYRQRVIADLRANRVIVEEE